MKRRNILAALGTLSAGGAFTVGSGAFSSVSAERGITVNVADDTDAFLRLAPCTGSPNGDYVDNTNGLLTIDLSAGNEDDPPGGNGVNPEALSVFHNVFEIGNQGTQDVCVDFEVDIPPIPNEADVPDRYEFGPGDPAVVFYRGANRTEYVNTSQFDPDRDAAISLPLDNGESECIGFEVRAFGFESGTDLFEDAELTIRADADAHCRENVVDPVPSIYGPTEGLVGYWPFDDGDVDDSTAVDASGNGNDGDVNGPTSTTGVGGVDANAAYFGGDDYIYINNDTSLVFGDGNDDEPFSVAAWVKIPEERNAHVVGKGTDVGSLEYLLNVDTDREWAQFRMYSGGGGRTIYRRVKYSTEYIDEWHHVVGTYDGSGSPSGISIYIDGEQVNTSDTRDTNYSAMSDRGDNVEIGSVLRDSDQHGGFFKGDLDEVRIYDRELTNSEIEDLADQF